MSGFVGDTVYIICSIELITTNRKIKEQKLKEIIAAICALLNSNGGSVVLVIDKKDINGKHLLVKTQAHQVSILVRILEQTMISIAGVQLTVSNVHFKEDKGSLVILVKKADSLITTNYNLYLPSYTQVVLMSTLEPVQRILTKNTVLEQVPLYSHEKNFVQGAYCCFQESKTVQYRYLKSDASKRTTLADRMTGKSNKFSCYVSAFANYNGGHIYYGINDEGIVQGQFIPSEEKCNIIKKVEKVLHKMIWPDQVGEPKRGIVWEIFFEIIVDENSNAIPSTFVIVIYIAACLGGVFTEEPECYEMVEGKVEKMSFATWKKKIPGPIQLKCFECHTVYCDCEGREFTEEPDYDTMEEAVEKMPLSRKERILQSTKLFQLDKIPTTVQRITWSSQKTRKICTQLDQKLSLRITYGNSILTTVTNATEKFPELVEVKLVVLSKKVMECYRSNLFTTAQELLKEYDALLPATEEEIFRAKRAYIEAALYRAQGEVGNLKKIFPHVLCYAEQTEPGLLSSAIYLLAATVTHLFQPNGDDKERKRQEYSSYLFPIRALEHLRYVQDSPTVRADLEQKCHLTLALFYLGCDISGVLTKDFVDSESLDKAKSSVTTVIESIVDGNPMNYYREVQFELVKSILSYRCSQVQDDRKIFFLKEAFNFSKNAETLASESRFKEMLYWARRCMALCTESLVRTHFKRLKPRFSGVPGIMTDSETEPKGSGSRSPPNDDFQENKRCHACKNL